VPLEAERCRHRAVAVPIFAVRGLMSAGRNSQISFRTRRGSVDTAATRSIAASTSVTSSSAPAVQQRLHQNSGRINAALQQLPPRT
jgi:hypothetical protein